MGEINWVEETNAPSPKAVKDWVSELRELDAGGANQARVENIETDPEKQGLRDFGERADLAFSGDTASEKFAAFIESNPEGDLFRHPDDGELYFRQTQSEKYRKVDPSIFSDSGRKADLIFDIADFAGEAPVFAAEVAAFAFTKNPTALKNTLTAGAAGITGEGVKQAAQSAMGTQRQSGTEITGELLEEGALSMTGEAATKPAVGLFNFVRGGASITLKEGAKAAQRATERLGLKSFTPGQLSRSPLIRVIEGQSRALSSSFEELLVQQKKGAISVLRRLGLQTDPKGATKRLTSLVRSKKNDLIARLRNPGITSFRAGEALKKGFQEWDDVAHAEVKSAYSEAKAAGTATYSLDGPLAVAQKLKAGTPGQARPHKVDTGIVDEAGNPVLEDAIEQFDLDPALEKQLGEVVEKIQKLDPSLPTTTANGESFDATDQLLALRTQLWELKTPEPGKRFTDSHRRAQMMYGAITKTLDSPVLDATAVKAVPLWKEARRKAHERFKVWDMAVVKELKKTDEPSMWASKLFRANNPDQIAFLKQIIPDNEWKTFKGFAGGKIIENPKILDSIDPETLSTVFSPADIARFRETTDALALLRAPEFEELAKKGFKNRKLVKQFLKNPAPAEVDAFIKAIGDDPVALLDVKTALIDDAVEGAMNAAETGTSDALKKSIAKWRDSGLTQLFDKKELRTLQGLVSYLSFGDVGVDTGTKLITAGLVAKLKDYSQEALFQIVHTIGIGKLLMTKPVQRFLVGRGARPLNIGGLKAFSAAIVAGADDISEQERAER